MRVDLHVRFMKPQPFVCFFFPLARSSLFLSPLLSSTEFRFFPRQLLPSPPRAVPPPPPAMKNHQDEAGMAFKANSALQPSSDTIRLPGTGGRESTERSFEVRQIRHLDRLCYIALQDENGPCPLLAVFNILSLRGSCTLRSSGSSRVSLQRIVHAVGNCVLEHRSVAAQNRVATPAVSSASYDPEHASNVEFLTNDAFDMLPAMSQGLDVNPRFRGIDDFEPTRATALFDCLGVRLVHGWIVDPTEVAESAAIGGKSYNAMAADGLTRSEESSSGAGGSVVRRWLQRHATQLTAHGIDCLLAGLAEHELAVHFRNNHFTVITKSGGVLFILVTDRVLATSTSAPVWQSLTSVSGHDSVFVGSFMPPPPSFATVPPKQVLPGRKGLTEQRYLPCVAAGGCYYRVCPHTGQLIPTTVLPTYATPQERAARKRTSKERQCGSCAVQ